MNSVASDDDRLARAIALQRYGMEPRLERVAQLNNIVFRLRFADGCKILKLAKGSEAGSIRKELMLMEALGRQGIPVPIVEHEDPAARLVGRPFFIMDSAGDRTVAHWLAGPAEIAGGLCAEMGSVLARIHGILFPASGDIQHDGIVPRDPGEYLQRLHRLAGWAVDQQLLDREEAALFESLNLPQMLGTELCHGDFHAVQCIVQDGRIAAVVDWESAWAGNATIDLAIAHAYLDYYAPPEMTGRFLAAYGSARSLPRDYDRVYLPVRMAHALGLLRVCCAQGRGQSARRAIDLFRGYSRAWRG